MNILLVSSDNSILSGAFNSLVFLAKELKEQENNVYVIVPFEGDGSRLLEQNGINYSIIKSFDWICSNKEFFPNMFSNLKTLKRMIFNNKILVKNYIDFITKNKIDIVHINTVYTYLAAIAAKKCKIKLIWHIREFLEEDQNNRFILKWYAKWIMNQSDRIICISKSIYSKYHKFLGNSKMSVVYNGVDINKYYNAQKEILDNQNIELLCVGPINNRKGQFDLIENLGVFCKKNPQYKVSLNLVGDYTNDNYMIAKQLIEKHHLENIVNICGKTANPVPFYQKADILCMCSISEAFGRVTVEGMLSGCLVMGRECAATSEIIADNKTGFLYRNSDDFEKKLIYIIQNRDTCKKIANNGRIFAKENYNSKRNANEIDKIYKEVVLS